MKWTNWDGVFTHDEVDPWNIEGDVAVVDQMEEFDEKRCGVVREQRQMEEIRRVHERRVSKIKIDREKFMSEEPYSFMCKIPVA